MAGAAAAVSVPPHADSWCGRAAPRSDPEAAAQSVHGPLGPRCVHRGRAGVRAGLCGRCRRAGRAARVGAHGGVLRRTAAVVDRWLAVEGTAVSDRAPGEASPIYTKTGDDGTTGLLLGG